MVPVAEVFATIVSFEEQTRGWLAILARAQSVTDQVVAYQRLSRHLEVYRNMPTLPFDAAAATEFQRIQKLRLRVGTLDMRIASIALSIGATVLTRNTVDFRRIPGLLIEDWLR